MKSILRYCLLLLLLPAKYAAGQVQADTTRHITDTLAHIQDSANLRHKVAIFVPLYLDSAFDASNSYRYDKSFPKFINPGLEFYEGVQLALDSLEKEDARLEVHI